jgi:hypothetical protein
MLLSDLSDLNEEREHVLVAANVPLFAFHPGALTLEFASPGNGKLPTSFLSAPPFTGVRR